MIFLLFEVDVGHYLLIMAVISVTGLTYSLVQVKVFTITPITPFTFTSNESLIL